MIKLISIIALLTLILSVQCHQKKGVGDNLIFDHDKKHIKRMLYGDNGKLKYEANYILDTTKSDVHFINDTLLHGLRVFYSDNGDTTSKSYWYYGKPVGESVWYYPGNIVRTIKFFDYFGDLIYVYRADSNSNVLKEEGHAISNRVFFSYNGPDSNCVMKFGLFPVECGNLKTDISLTLRRKESNVMRKLSYSISDYKVNCEFILHDTMKYTFAAIVHCFNPKTGFSKTDTLVRIISSQ